jgi:RES domain-containing protein
VKRNKKNRARKSIPTPSAKPTLLDAFTQRDLEIWDTRSIDLQIYHDRVYYDLERQRAARYDQLCVALRAAPAIELPLNNWKRVTDWRWSLAPLSPAGSLKGIGGRFNIGADLDRARGQAFPCLYLAQDVETAFREYFGGSLASPAGKLTLSEFALRRETSFTTFSLRGRIEQAFDLRERAHLSWFAKVIAQFDVSSDTKKFARKVRLPPRSIIRTSQELWKRLMASPREWRTEPQMFGIPAASQIFGRFIRDAGFEAVLYSSQQGGAACVAVFPENFRAGASRIEVVGELPAGASCTVLDKDNQCLVGVVS